MRNFLRTMLLSVAIFGFSISTCADEISLKTNKAIGSDFVFEAVTSDALTASGLTITRTSKLGEAYVYHCVITSQNIILTGGNFTILNLPKTSKLGITSIDLSKALKLVTFNCSGCELTTVDFIQNISIRSVSVSYNKIKGEGMDALIASLPNLKTLGVTQTCRLRVINPAGTTIDYSEGNETTATQVAAAAAKGWTVTDENGTIYAGISAGVDNQVVDNHVGIHVVFNAFGEKMNKQQNGINIIKYDNGKTVKVISHK